MEDRTRVVEAFLDAFNNHDLDAMLEWLDPDAYFVPSGHELAPERGDFSGHDGFREWWRRSSAWRWHIEARPLEPLAGDRVFADLQVGVGDASTWTTVSTACVYTVRGGGIVAIEVFSDPERTYALARRPGVTSEAPAEP